MLLISLLACGPGADPFGSGDTGWTLEASEQVVTVAVAEARFTGEHAALLDCTGPDDDHHLVRATAAREHRLLLSGLLPDADYSCLLTTTSASGDQVETTLTLRTEPLPDFLAQPVLLGDPDALTGTWTLYNPFSDGTAVHEQAVVIVDPLGRIRWYHELGDRWSAVDASYVGDGRVLMGGGRLVATMVNLEGQVLFEGPEPLEEDAHTHHHSELRPNGLIAQLVSSRTANDDHDWAGFGLEFIDSSTGDVRWRWTSQEGVDQGALPQGYGDLYHANSLQVDDESGQVDAVWVNARNWNRVIRVDGETGEVDLKLGPNTDWTLLGEDGEPAEHEEWFSSTHDFKRTGDRLLMYDNGNGNPAHDASRLVELQLDEQAQTAQITWTWTREFFTEPAWGGVDRLSDERVLAAIGHCDNCAASDPDNRTAILEIDQASGEVIWELRYEDSTWGLYRAQRLDGCSLFTATTWCEARR